jgi:HSP20 family protein
MQRQNNPFADLERMFERMTDQFDDAAEWWTEEGRPGTGARPAADVVDHADEIVVTVDVPGFTSEEVDIRVSDRTLRVEADHSETAEEHDGDYVRRERHHATATRSLRLPAEVDPDAASATLTNGVLTVTLPKSEAEETRRIDID